MNTFQLECFLAVAGTLNFARAAEQLNVSQPTITHQIKSLEDELEVKLFHRSTRMVELSGEGKSFISDAKSLLSIERQAKMKLGTSSEKHIEHLSIGCSNYIQLAMFTPVLKRFRDEIPELHPHLFVSPYEQLFQILEADRIDLIFGVYEQSLLKNGAKYKKLLQSNVVCVCRKETEFAQKEATSIKELKNEVLIFCDPMSLSSEMAQLQYRLGEGRAPSDVHFCSSSAAAYVLARSGFGVALLPDILVPNDPEIAKIALNDSPSLSFGMFYRSTGKDTLKRQFIAAASEIFKSTERAEI